MRKTPLIKLYVVSLAALGIISAVLVHIEYRKVDQTREAKIAAQLEEEHEQVKRDDEEYRAQHQAEIDEQEQFKRQVEALKKKVHTYAGDASKTITTNP